MPFLFLSMPHLDSISYHKYILLLLYPILYKLLDNAYISDYEVRTGNRRIRVYYHLKKKGEDYLYALIKSYANITTGITQIMAYKKNTID